MTQVRPAAVAGMFYPGSVGTLRAAVEELIESVPPAKATQPGPKAVVAPHAGYLYSGPTAAHAFRALAADREVVRRIVLLGPAHRVPIRGLALPADSHFETPLGRLEIDQDLAVAAAELPQVTVSGAAHAHEHSLEVELPFLQVLFDDLTILPLVVGDATAEEVEAVLDAVWGGDETRIVVSSDLSHYHSYEAARRLDEGTSRAILALEGPIDWDRACGATPLNGLLAAARRRGMTTRRLDLRNSGDTAGDRSQVVGYGAFAFTEAPAA